MMFLPSPLQRVAVVVLALLAYFPAFIRAKAPAASTFYLEETETQFSVNLANHSSDVFIYFTSPAYSWVGVGFGENMKDSLMFIMYLNQNGDNLTISPRLATDHSEPNFTPSVELDTLPGTGLNDSMFVLNARCRNCRVWPNGFIDESNRNHPMIYAFGHGHGLQSDSPSAPLRRHIRYGKFSMDMTAATASASNGDVGVPEPDANLRGVRLRGGMVRDHDRANLAHAILGCLALFLIWPLNVIFAGFWRNIRIHVGVSVVLGVFLVVTFALGGVVSWEYNRSKSFTSAHQILAFLSLAPILLLSLLPYPRISALHPLIPRLHTPLSTLAFALLVITGGLGFHLSSQARAVILGYTAVALAVFFFLLVVQAFVKRRGSAYARATTRRRLGEEDDRDLMLANYWADRKLQEEDGMGASRSASSSSNGSSSTHGGHTRGGAGPGGSVSGSVFGGGTMPGPQYLLNMHPGVPVTFK